MSDGRQLTFLLSATVGAIAILILAAIITRLVAVYGPWSARFNIAKASTNLRKKLKNVVGPGVEILMPVGRGCYALLISNSARRSWENTIAEWMSIGVRLTVFITASNAKGTEYWSALTERYPCITVLVLDRELASPEDATEIERLDQFHPVLVLKDGLPLAMWIENFHPLDSRIAYNVEFIAAEDIVGYQRARFYRFLKVLHRLTAIGDKLEPRQLLPHDSKLIHAA